MKNMDTKNLGMSLIGMLCLLILSYPQENGCAQPTPPDPGWILPNDWSSPAVWGIRGGIVVSLWPSPVGTTQPGTTGGPRGLLRIGHNFEGETYLINFIAVEPVVNGEMEYSEVSPSRVDGKVGKFMWAGDSEKPGRFYPYAITRGTITHPDPEHPDVEQFAFYIFMEKFLNGAHPYLKITIRDDRPEEIGLEIFHQKDSAPMERCALTATMGNYSRVRLLYLKDRVVDSRELYKGFDGLHFIEKEGYPAGQLLKDRNGDFIAIAATNESFSELSSWPQEPGYYARRWWRYRPFYKVTQYWRKESAKYDSSLHVRINGRAKYWSGASEDESDYIDIPGGISFENFEMREKYYSGQKFYFGVTRKTPQEMGLRLPG